MMKENKPLKFLRTLMYEKNLTAVDLAEKLGESYRNTRTFLSQGRFPDEHVEELSKILGVSGDEIEQNGIKFWKRKKYRHTLNINVSKESHSIVSFSKENIIELIHTISSASPVMCSLKDLVCLVKIQRDVPVPLNDELVKSILSKCHKEQADTNQPPAK